MAAGIRAQHIYTDRQINITGQTSVKLIAVRPSKQQSVSSIRISVFTAAVFGVLGLVSFAPPAMAKEASLTAIELYDGPNGSAYVELAEVLVNGKAELRECSVTDATVDKSAYGKMPKVVMVPDGILERGADGILRYSTGQKKDTCVVPVNVKFERKGSYSLSEMADFAVLKGVKILASSEPQDGPAPLKKGVKLVYVSAANTEFADYLLAQRITAIDGWKTYLHKYPASVHAPNAKHALALLYVAAGRVSLENYQSTAASAAPAYGELKNSKTQADLARALVPNLEECAKLDGDVRDRLLQITENGHGELNAYHEALTAHTAGYAHLLTAKKLSETVNDIAPEFEPDLALLADAQRDNDTYEAALQMAGAAVEGKQFDKAYASVAPYRSFSGEDARVAAVIDAAYDYHFQRGKKLEETNDWVHVIAEYEKAGGTKDTTEARDALKTAREKLMVAEDRAAAETALNSSKEFEAQKDMIHAYEVLSSLPAAQQAMVADEMTRLAPAYVQAASLAAKNLRQAHDPIKGLGDEIGIENAYVYLQRAYQISGNESFKDRMALLGNDLSTYLLSQAKHYLTKPAGSGSELGWTYLSEALPYKASNLGAVRDSMVAAASAHTMRSKLSIRVQFRDQTSQRDSAGFAGQLENAIIAGLESSRVPVKVVRFGETESVEPDFQLAGDVLQHHIAVVPTITPVESKYRAGEREVPNEDWNKINRTYETANIELRTAQAALQGAEAKGNKRAIEDLKKQVEEDTKKVEALHLKLDSAPKTTTADVVRTYTYSKRTIDVSGIVQLQFRIGESLTGQMTDAVPITKEAHTQVIVLENVKPDDTEGVKQTGTTPDTVEFVTSLEGSALDELVAAVRNRVEALPRKIYSAASSREAEGDLDGAGESYLRYLHLTHEDGSNEREHAKLFLQEQFNMRPGSASNQ
jgi:hypothetical protein